MDTKAYIDEIEKLVNGLKGFQVLGVLRMDFKMYFQEIENLVDKLEHEDFDCVLGVLRGGYVPAEIVSRALNIPLTLIRLSSYSNRERSEIKELGSIGEPFGKILIVDDLIDSGETLKFLLNKYPGSKTAVIFNKDVKRDLEPDFYSVKVKNEWIVQPMEDYDDYFKSRV